jgi:O-methyltransferase involved in polyketide biosynthesis
MTSHDTFANECSHQDSSRKTVGVTALGTAYLRALESSKGEHALFNDPFSECNNAVLL